jgi:phage baseplate assembly protein W
MGSSLDKSNMSVLIPHFSFPFRPDGTSFAVVEQDTPSEIQDCVQVCMLTPPGSRLVEPDYGVPEILYSQFPANIPGIIAALARWEPRASVTLDETLNTIDQKVAYLQIAISGGSY